MFRIHRSRRQDAGANRLDDRTCRGGEEVLQTIAGVANRNGSSIIDSVKHGLANLILDSGIRFCVVKSKGGGESPPHQTNAPNQCGGFGCQIRNGQCLGGEGRYYRYPYLYEIRGR